MDEYSYIQKKEAFERFCEAFDKAKNITEMTHELKYSVFKISHFPPITDILNSYEGKFRQVGHRFEKLRATIKAEIAKHLGL